MYETRAELFRALGDPTRLRILALLRIRQACVCELVELLPVSQPAVSQHLRKLKQVGLVSERRQKYWTYYALRDDLPPAVTELVRDLPRVPDQEEWLSAHRVDSVCPTLPNSDASPLLTITGG